MHFQDELLMRLLGSTRKRVSLLLWVWGFFLPLNLFCLFSFIALKRYFRQRLSYKYLLFFFSSFPPSEKGRGPIENSALSLSGEFKCGSNNRFLLLFFFKFPVVLLPRSALKENRKGSLEYVHLYTQRQKGRPCKCAFVGIYKNFFYIYIYICKYIFFFPHSCVNTHICIFSCSCLFVTISQHVLTVKLLEIEEKMLRMGKVWKYCSVVYQNINPPKNSPLQIANALKKYVIIPDSSYSFPWLEGERSVILQAALFHKNKFS